MSDDHDDQGSTPVAAPSDAAISAAPTDRPAADPAGDDTSTNGGAKRRRGPRGGRGRGGAGGAADGDAGDDRNPELPDRASENRPRDLALLDQAVVRKPQIGDTRPAPPGDSAAAKVGDTRPSRDA